MCIVTYDFKTKKSSGYLAFLFKSIMNIDINILISLLGNWKQITHDINDFPHPYYIKFNDYGIYVKDEEYIRQLLD